MRILAVDTSTEICGVAIAEGSTLLAEITLAHGQTHAKFLMEAIQNALALTRTHAKDVQGLVVSRGPGSFTGLRIGISTVKGLAVAWQKPAVGISSLAVLAHQADGIHPLICPMIDARRKEIYWSLYRRQDDKLVQQIPDQVGDVRNVLDCLQEPCLFVGSGALFCKKQIDQTLSASALWPSPIQHAVRAGVLAKLGWQHLQKALPNDIQDLAPVYLRRSDAEINLSRR